MSGRACWRAILSDGRRSLKDGGSPFALRVINLLVVDTPALQGRSIVIVGGTTGLGLSAARAVVSAGARVVLVGRSAESAFRAGAELGEAAITLVAEATHEETAPQAIDLAVRNFGRLGRVVEE